MLWQMTVRSLASTGAVLYLEVVVKVLQVILVGSDFITGQVFTCVFRLYREGEGESWEKVRGGGGGGMKKRER